MADRFAAAGVSVSDLKRSVEFYTRVLGMRETQTFKLPNMDESVVGFEKGGSVVLMQYTDGVARDHAAFAGKLVFYVDDVGAIVARIRDAGGVITREPSTSPGLGPTLIAFAKDPDGYTLELLQASKREKASS